MSVINLSLDLSPIVGMSEFIQSLAEGLNSEETRGNISKSMGEDAAAAFNSYADAYALANPLRLWHVYEAGMVGDPAGHLWRLYLSGPTTDKILQFDWAAAHKPNLVGARAHRPIEGDTRKSVHVFVWKAPILEEGAEMHIQHSDAKEALAFPAGFGDGGFDMAFSKGVIDFQTPRANIGQFESMWEKFWREAVDTIIEQDFVIPTEKTLSEQIPRALLQLRGGVSRKPMGFSVNLKPKTDMRALAQACVLNLNSGYVRQAHQREAFRASSGI